MAAAVQRGQEAAGLSSTEGCKEAVQGILKALQLCVGKLQQTNDAVSFAINWDKIQCLPSVGPTFLSSVLHQHICDLQPLLDRLQSLSNGNGEKSVGLERAEESHCTLDVIEPKERVDADITSKLNTNNVLVDSNCVTNPAAVQIQARKSEIDRRILAFIERKQAEINENNVREFCNVIDCNQENSCARTDAVFTPFPGFKSHVKVSRVLNAYGPQTRTDSSASSSRAHSLPQESGNQAVEERLQNIECHLRLKQGGPVPTDIYQRIKKLEDRILELEGISPEYFQSMDASSKRKKVQASQNYSLVELDQKINALRQTLIQKSKRETSRTDIVLA